MATAGTGTRVDAQKALAFWAEYQKEHDVSDWIGQTVGIDPEGREVHFGRKAAEVVMRLADEGRLKPLLFLRVGYNYYIKKVGKRWLRAK